MLHLYLHRARYTYTCDDCVLLIERGQPYFRTDPFPWARIKGQQKVEHLCPVCVLGEVDGRHLLKHGQFSSESQLSLDFDANKHIVSMPPRVELVDISEQVVQMLADKPELMFQLNPESFEALICDRFKVMGWSVIQVGNATFRKDGGIDLIAIPKESMVPSIVAVQVKHTASAQKKVGSPEVRDLAGCVEAHGLNAGLIVTNTTFTPDARHFASLKPFLLQLHDFEDLSKWLKGQFPKELAWRHLPREIEICPGVKVSLR